MSHNYEVEPVSPCMPFVGFCPGTLLPCNKISLWIHLLKLVFLQNGVQGQRSSPSRRESNAASNGSELKMIP